MPGEEIGFDRLTQVSREEVRRKTLVTLEADFWERLQAYLRRLEEDLAQESKKSPSSPRATLLRDELRKAQRTRDQTYAYRERKIASLACAQASGAQVEPKGLTRLEQELFLRLVAELRKARSEARGEATLPPLVAALPAPTSGEPKGVEGRRKVETHEMAVVEVLEDLPPFAGKDTTYRLKKGDLVTLPPTIAKVLVERGKAREIKLEAQ